MELALWPCGVLCLVLRNLPRDETLRIRLACRALCERVSMILADEHMCRVVAFERRIRPAGRDIAPFVAHMRARFGIAAPGTWELRVEACDVGELGADIVHFDVSVRNRRRCDMAFSTAAVDATRCITDLNLARVASLDGLDGLARAVAQMDRLTSLNLKSNDLRTLAPLMCTGLTRLNLAKGRLSSDAWTSLAAHLSPSLTDLDLGMNELRGKIAASLARFTRLTRLDLRDNCQLSDLVGVLGSMRLVHLEIGGNDALLLGMPRITGLVHLGVSSARVDSALDAVLESSPALTHLDLSWTDHRVSAAAMSTLHSVRYLDLSAGGMSPAWLAVLRSMSGLTYLDVSDNYLEEVSVFADALSGRASRISTWRTTTWAHSRRLRSLRSSRR
jgi:hypothetical protein